MIGRFLIYDVIIFIINLFASLLFYFNQNYFDAALFKLQLLLPQMGYKPYIDFEFYYPFFYVELSKYIGGKDIFFGFIVYILNFALSVLAFRMSETSSMRFGVAIFIMLQAVFFSILGTEPLSLIVLLTIFLFFHKHNGRNKILLIALFSALLAIRWDRAVLLFIVIILYAIILFINKKRKAAVGVLGEIFLYLTSAIVINITYVAFMLDVNILDYYRMTVISPSIISKHRSLPNIASILSMGLIVVTSFMSLICIRLAWINFEKKFFIFYLMPFALLPYAVMRPDWAHLFPFLLLSIIPFFLSYAQVINKKYYFAIAISIVAILIMIGLIFTQKSRESLVECQFEIRKLNAKSLYVTDSKFTTDSVNYPVFYHLNPDLLLVSKYISDEPGIREQESVKSNISQSFEIAPRPIILLTINGAIDSRHYLKKYIVDSDAYKTCRVKNKDIAIYEIK